MEAFFFSFSAWEYEKEEMETDSERDMCVFHRSGGFRYGLYIFLSLTLVIGKRERWRERQLFLSSAPRIVFCCVSSWHFVWLSWPSIT